MSRIIGLNSEHNNNAVADAAAAVPWQDIFYRDLGYYQGCCVVTGVLKKLTDPIASIYFMFRTLF